MVELKEIQEKLKEEKRILVAGLMFGFLLGFAVSVALKAPSTGLSKAELGSKTISYINNNVLKNRTMSIEYTSVKESKISGIYNVTVKIKETNVTVPILISKGGNWFVRARKIS